MIYFVGAGSGAVDLITVKGAKLLENADIVVYAGSLVNKELLNYCNPNCKLHDSAYLNLEQVLEIMLAGENEGKTVIRLHTGDPCLYGAIREQMDVLDKNNVRYQYVPGVSSFCGAAAALNAEYTLPGVSQSVIITRMAGRTPVPEAEALSKMASHGCTMVIFLSTGLLKNVKDELLKGAYTKDTPAAIVYKATWQDEKVFRCTVDTLPQTAQENNITSTALIVVGNVLDCDYELSKLYDKHFETGFRKAEKS